jgi:outer membrane protein OmpA-like peptidoglycan-associated protein
MPRSSVIVRSLAVVSLGLVAVPAFGQSANVTAFNPYGGVAASGGSAPVSVYASPPGDASGMAFNPWNPGGVAASAAYSGRGDVQAPSASSSYSYGTGSYGTGLPDPPPGPIESRLTAVPQRPDRTAAPTPRTAAIAPPPPSAPAPVVVETPVAPPPSAPAPIVATPSAPPPPVVAAPAPPPPVVSTPAPAPPPRAVASVAPPPPEPAPPAPAAVMASVTFTPQSAEIGTIARAELDRVAQNVKGTRGIELRAYANGSDPTEARKIALARALAVRSYLIDLNVKTRIEVGAFASTGGGSERVDVLAP